MLLSMALLFYLPHMLWWEISHRQQIDLFCFRRNGSRYLGFDLQTLIQEIKKVVKRDIHKVALQIHIALKFNVSKYSNNRRRSFYYFARLLPYSGTCRKDNSSRLIFSVYAGNRLSLLYFFVKILYIINCFCQFHLLSIFLSFSFPWFGYEWISMTLTKVQTKINNQTNDSKWFPRVVMCDFMIRQLGSNQHWMYVILWNIHSSRNVL